MPKTASERILKLADQQSLVRPRDVAELGMARETLVRLYRQGLLVRPARGVYALPESSVSDITVSLSPPNWRLQFAAVAVRTADSMATPCSAKA